MPSTYNLTPIEGVNFKDRFVPSLERPVSLQLGTPVLGNQNDTWVYVQSDVLVTAANTATVNQTTFHITAAGAGNYTADTAFAIGEAGWIRKTTSPLA